MVRKKYLRDFFFVERYKTIHFEQEVVQFVCLFFKGKRDAQVFYRNDVDGYRYYLLFALGQRSKVAGDCVLHVYRCSAPAFRRALPKLSSLLSSSS